MAVEGFEDLDFHEFHRRELPRRLADGNGALASAALRREGSLAFRLPGGDAYTYVPRADGVDVVAGDDGADTVIELGPDEWEGLVHDYESAPGLLYGGRVRCRRGHAMSFVRWEPGLRAMFVGRPWFDPHTARLEDGDGNALDPERTFTLESDRAEMARFLRAAGYLLVRGAFRPDEVEAFAREARSLRSEAVRGDKLSWWAKNADGEDVCCRVTRAADGPALATLRKDPRILGLVELADEPLVSHRGEGNGVTVIFKRPGMTEGLSDLPWHRDCGMGGHSVMCPILICSVFLTPATAETGPLHFLPGSWRGTCGFMEATDRNAPAGAGFDAAPGDLTIHYGDVMHAAPPPTRGDLDTYRISATVAFARPDVRHHRGGRSYNDVLHQREDGHVEHLARVAERT